MVWSFCWCMAYMTWVDIMLMVLIIWVIHIASTEITKASLTATCMIREPMKTQVLRVRCVWNMTSFLFTLPLLCTRHLLLKGKMKNACDKQGSEPFHYISWLVCETDNPRIISYAGRYVSFACLWNSVFIIIHFSYDAYARLWKIPKGPFHAYGSYRTRVQKNGWILFTCLWNGVFIMIHFSYDAYARLWKIPKGPSHVNATYRTRAFIVYIDLLHTHQTGEENATSSEWCVRRVRYRPCETALSVI